MSDRRRTVARLLPAGLVILLGAALVIPPLPTLQLESTDRSRVAELHALLARLPREGVVVVGFDPDLGTYAEIRPTVRALLADLLQRGARLVLVSLTPEGRALAVTELDRLRRVGVDEAALLDLGFRPGAEAALVSLVARPVTGEANGPVAEALSAKGLAAAALVVVVGGNDIGPSAWVEQVRTRAPALPLAAIAPTVLLPELQPYRATGQLEALIGTVRDGAAYRASVALDTAKEVAEERPIAPLPLLLGMLVALGMLLQSVGVRLVAGVRAARSAGEGV